LREQAKKRLCIVLPDHWAANFGGAEYQAKVLIDALVADGGFDITYLARNVSESYTPSAYKIRRVRTCRKLTRYADFFDLPSLYTLLRNARPDVIYQTVGSAYTGATAFYARRAGARMVWQIASDVDVEPFEGGLSLNYPFRYIEKKLLEYGVRNATTIVAQTRKQDALLHRHYLRHADAVIPNFHPQPRELIDKREPVSVLWVANLKPLKRPELFVRLAQDLRAEGRDARFIMVGRGGNSDWHQAILKTISASLAVDYLGERTQEQVNELLAQASILVNTSEYEGFPNTFIQAWMRQVPVISMGVDPDGVMQRIGIGVVANTYEQMRDGVRRFVDDSELRIETGDRARDFAMENYSERNAQEIIRMLRD
jgi:glycosyltransferase involved in cell wall biosynthesis